MPAYVAVHAKVKNPEKLAEYSKAAGQTVADHGGTFTIRAPIDRILTGEADYNRFVLIEFPDLDTARGWYDSPEYQALIPVRDEGADMLFTLSESA